MSGLITSCPKGRTMTLSMFPTLSDSALGFERLFNNMQKVAEVMSANQNFPPHSLVKLEEDSFEIKMAVAGFGKEDIAVEVKEDVLSVVSNGVKKDDNVANVIYAGIAFRPFKKMFLLGEHVNVVEAKLEDGILSIRLRRDIPEEKKAKQIELS